MTTLTLADHPHVERVQTRWGDNDAYGHVNNVVYYGYFDTVINRVLIHRGGLDIHAGDVIGVCAESGCRYLRPVAYPDALDVGLRVARLGTSSVRYELAVFRADDPALCATGYFVHVFVDRVNRRPTRLPAALRAVLAGLAVPAP